MIAAATTDSRLRTSYIWLVALAAACLFGLVFTASSNAYLTKLTHSGLFQDRNAGAGSNYVMSSTFAYSGVSNPQARGDQGDDLRFTLFDWPTGLVGNPNAVRPSERCNVGNPAAIPEGSQGQSYNYFNCPASSIVGSIEVDVAASVNLILWWQECPMTMTGNVYLLRNHPTVVGTPEVPTYVGIAIGGSAGGLCDLAGSQDMTMTAKITVRDADQGLRIQMVDGMPRTKSTSVGNAHIRVNAIRQTLNAKAANGNIFMRNPSRCLPDKWTSSILAATWDGGQTNGNLPPGTSFETVNGVQYVKANNVQDATPVCARLPEFQPKIKVENKNKEAGAAVGIKATLENPSDPNMTLDTGATNADYVPYLPPLIKKVSMAMPKDFRVNPAVGERLGTAGCTDAQFNKTKPALDPTCPPSSEIGTNAVTVPHITGDLYGKLYLGQPHSLDEKLNGPNQYGTNHKECVMSGGQAVYWNSTKPCDSDENEGIFRLYQSSKRGGVSVKFEGRARVNQDKDDPNYGQISVEFGDPSYSPAESPGLPQFSYSKFILDFDSASTGVGKNPDGSNIYNPVYNPDPDRQMMMNPQVCGEHPMDTTFTPWTVPAQGEKVVSNTKDGSQESLRVEQAKPDGYPGGADRCDFKPFDPSFSVRLTEDYTYTEGVEDSDPNSMPNKLAAADPVNGVGMHPTMTFSVMREDRMDNFRDLRFVMPEGFGGSIKSALKNDGTTWSCPMDVLDDVAEGRTMKDGGVWKKNGVTVDCLGKAKVGSVRVKTGAGPAPVTIYGDIVIIDRNDYRGQNPTGVDEDMAGVNELMKYTAKLAVVTPADVGPFRLGAVVNKLYMKLATSDKFQLSSETAGAGLDQSIRGIPVLYQEITLKLDGINKQGDADPANDRPFLFLPSKCHVSLMFQGQITSFGMPPATGPTTATPTSTPVGAATTSPGRDCNDQAFDPTVQVAFGESTPATPSNMSVTVNVPQTEVGVTNATIQQSTINRVRVQFPPGIEMNPAVAENLEACPTSAIDDDIANPNADTNSCADLHPKSKLGDVFVNTPLLPDLPGKDYAVDGAMYLEEQGPTADTRMRFVLYLAMPGGMQVVRGGARVAGSTEGPTAGLGSTAETTSDISVIDGTPLSIGQIESDFNGLPDVTYGWMRLEFNGAASSADPNHIVPMFVTPEQCGTHFTRVRVNSSNEQADTDPDTWPPGPANKFFNTATPNLSFVTAADGTHPCKPDADFTPEADIKVDINSHDELDPAIANNPTERDETARHITYHPNMKASILRADGQRDLRKTVFHLPAGMTGAPTATDKCSVTDAANANCAPKSIVGAVEVELGSGDDTIVIDNGKIYNTEPASADEPARLTTNATIQLGPFDLGKMSIPILASLRADDGGLDATVTLPQRFEGIKTHFRRLSMIMYGMADQGTPDMADDKPFLTNPSRCTTNTFTLDAWDDVSDLNGPPNAQADNEFDTIGCPEDFPAGTLPTMDITTTSSDSESPTGLTIAMKNGTATSFNPTIKSIFIEFPHGMTVNPAVGNDGMNAACDSASIDAGGSACPAASKKGEVSIKTPLLADTYYGDLFLETPGTTKETRYRLAMVIHLPGTDLVIRGSNLIDGSSDLTGPTGSVDEGTGVITAAFDDLVDLPFHEMNLTLYGGNRALLVNPAECGSVVMRGEIKPHSGTNDEPKTITTSSSYDVTGCQPTPPEPTFEASLTEGQPGDTTYDQSAGHPTFNLKVGNLGKSPQIREFNLDLPSGFVADTVQTTRCDRADADAGDCDASSLVGSVSTAMGSPAELLEIDGELHNVVPETNDMPAQLQVIMDVVVGPFDLGKLSIPVYTEMRKDYGITTKTQLPYTYEGIHVFVRSMELSVSGYVGGKPFMINPTECGDHTITANIVRRSGPPVDPISEDVHINGCPRSFTDPIGLTVTPSTTETAVPVGLTFDISTTIDNPTLTSMAMTMPEGLELNPAVANGLTTCPSAEINNSGGAACKNTTAHVGDVELETPLLPTTQFGEVYLEDPIGIDKDTRYRTAIVVHLPGKDMIVRGEVKIDGSSTIQPGGKGSQNTGTGQISTVFWGDEVGTPLPDLAFSTMSVAFHDGPRAMFLNPRECTTASFDALITAHGGGVTSTASDSYNTTSDCGNPGFSPSFDIDTTSTVSAANPDLTLNFTSPPKDAAIKSVEIDLPTGLVAATGNVDRCSTKQADLGNCTSASDIGDITASIGASADPLNNYEINGDLHNVAPLPGEPARLSAMIDVQVGPFDLGKLTVPIEAELRHDWGVTTTAVMPERYEGIAVNMRAMSITLAGQVGGKGFAINPSKCQNNTISVAMESHDGQTKNDSDSFTTTGCAPFASGDEPSLVVTPSTKQAGAPVGMRIDVNAETGTPPQGAPTIRKTEVIFPEGLEINAAFAKDLVPCPTATIDSIIATGVGDCTGTKIADVTMTTHLMSSRPQGGLYIETPGLTKADRYRVALVLDLPGPTLVVRGEIDINGTTTINPGGTGSTDESATGQLTAVFDNIPDLGFTQMRLDFNAGSKAMVVNPTSCTPHEFTGKFTPNSVATESTATSQYTPTGCGESFAPDFEAIVSDTTSAGHPDLTLKFKNPANQQELHNFKVHLPEGLVANTNATATRCDQADARDAQCDPSQVVGEFKTWIGSTDANPLADDRVELTDGKIYNVTPNADEPARLQATMPVEVGPFDLGILSIPVTTKLNPDMSVDADTTIPTRYEGIAVKLREMDMHLYGTIPGGDDFMINPSRCATHEITAVMKSVAGRTSTRSSSYATTDCAPVAAAYSPSVAVTNTPQTAGAPTHLGINVSLPGTGSTTSNVTMELPEGLEISPGAGENLEACDEADVDAGGSACPATSRLASIELTTPLLDGIQYGELYLEPSIGRAAATRFRVAMVVHLPGQDLVVRGGTLVDGSSDLQHGTGVTDTGTGQVTAEFPGLPDLGFSNLEMTFDGARRLFVNPKDAGTWTVDAHLTPHAGSTAVDRTASFTTVGGTSLETGFAPTMTGSLTPSQTGANADLNLQITNPDGMEEIKSFDLNLPEGLVARTQGVPQCAPGDAEVNNCTANSVVGSVETTIGSTQSADGTLTVDGDIVNVVPDGDQPARFFASVPVEVGPFDLGNLTIDVPTKLNSDLTVTASTELPSRYEGIAVRVRALDLTIEGQPAGGTFMVAPSKCGPGTVTADFKSGSGATAQDSFGFNITGCPRGWDVQPEMVVSATPAVRNAPTNLTFKLTSDPGNPTIQRMRVEMPDDMEINPAFGEGLLACDPADVDDGGDACPAKSRIGTVQLKTHLLDPDKIYTGDVFLETPGNTALTRFKIAIVAHMPGADLVVRGQVEVVGATDVQPGETGSTAYAGPGKIIATFDDIPDLGFSELTVLFNTNRPMLINAPTDGVQQLQIDVSPHSANVGQRDANLSPSYTTTGGSTPATFNPTLKIGTPVNRPAAGNSDLGIEITRSNNNSESIKELQLDLPVGLVARPAAVDQCTEADAEAALCGVNTPDSKVGTFTTRIGNGATASEDLTLTTGEIYNVVPRGDEPARLAAAIEVAVGPYNMGWLAIPITTELREDAGVTTHTTLPSRYEGIAVHIKEMAINLLGEVNGKPFMQNPSRCGTHTLTATMTSVSGASTVTKRANFNTTGCDKPFTVEPTMDVSTSNQETSLPAGLSVNIQSDEMNPTIGDITLKLPQGMSINAYAGDGLVTCSPDVSQVDYGCDPDAVQGTVSVHTPLLDETYTGKLFLENPLGNDKDTRYRMAIVLDLPGQSIVVRGRVMIDGSTTIPTGGVGSTAVTATTGQITTVFDAVPDLSFDDFTINLKTGPKALLTNPDTCGDHAVEASIRPNSSSTAVTLDPAPEITVDEDCMDPRPFNPTFSWSAPDSTSGANTDLTLNIDAGSNKDTALTGMDIQLPVGLVADTTATDQCTQAEMAAADCGNDSQIGELTTTIGTNADPAETLELSGTIHNVVPNSDEPARLGAMVAVEVGPYDLGNLVVPVTTKLRPDDYGINATTELPTFYEGIRVRVRSMQMTMFGEVGTPPATKGFIKNPSACAVHDFNVVLTSANGDVETITEDYEVDGCGAGGFESTPQIAISGQSTDIEATTGMTLDIDSAADNPTIKDVATTLPPAITLNPAVGNHIEVCLPADIAADSCQEESVIGTVEMETPLLAGTHTGKVVLEGEADGSAERYKLAIIINLPGTDVIVHGLTIVDGTTALPDGMGSTAETGVTGQITANFNALPDLNFSHLRVKFDDGPKALLANVSECLTGQNVSAEFISHRGGAAEPAAGNPAGEYDLTAPGGGACVAESARGFDPTFSVELSSDLATDNPDLTIRVAREDGTKQLKSFDVTLPPGLVADTVDSLDKPGVPRCSLTDAAKADCDSDTRVGDVATEIGTGSELLRMTGAVHNVETLPGDVEPARLAAMFDVIVGPYDLGKLSIPVETEIVQNGAPKDLTVQTHTTIPQRYEGVPVRMRSMEVKLNGTVDGKRFMINPSQCGQHTVKASFTPTSGAAVDKTDDFTVVGCPSNFMPTVDASISTNKAGSPTGFTFEINSPLGSSSIRSATTKLPVGFEINPGVANRAGGLVACDPANITPTNVNCDPSSEIGTVHLETPLLPMARTGKVYLETPTADGNPATRYRLAIVISLPGGQNLVVHGQAHVDGEGQGIGAGTGQVSATFEDLPDMQFSKLVVTFDAADIGSNDHTMLVSPKVCSSVDQKYEAEALLTPWSTVAGDDDAKSVTSSEIVVDDDCDQTTFEGTSFNATVAEPYQAASSDLQLQVTAGPKSPHLQRLTIGLPVGLVANTTAADPCPQAVAETGDCLPVSKIGEFTTAVGNGGDPLVVSGEVHNVEPDADEPARMAASVEVLVGPYDLGKLVIPVKTKIGEFDYDNPAEAYPIEAITDVPTRFEGVAIQMRSIDMTMYGEVPATSNDFIVNPSRCGTHTVTADLMGDNGSHELMTSDIAITGAAGGPCAVDFLAAPPTVTPSVNPDAAMMPTSFGLAIHSDAGNQTFNAIRTTLPEGMTINPAFANSFDTMTTCPSAVIRTGDLSSCASAQIGDVTLKTPLIKGDANGELHGKVYLEEQGDTAAQRYQLAIAVDAPGRTLIVRGRTELSGSTELDETNPVGSTAETDGNGDPVGRMTAIFENIPDLGFTDMTVEFNTDRQLLTNPQSCGVQQLEVEITPTGDNGNTPAVPVAADTFTTDCSDPTDTGFEPTFTTHFSTDQAGGNPNVTMTVTRDDREEQLKEFDLALPPGLVADTVATDRCDEALAAKADCPENTRVGELSTSVGTGGEYLTVTGGLYNVETDLDADEEPARLAAVLDVQVGPYDLGRLPVDVKTEIIGTEPEDLAIKTHTVVPQFYEGIPVRLHQMEIRLDGTANAGTPQAQPFMINPSKCATHVITAQMTSAKGTVHTPTSTFETTNCGTAPYSPSLTASLNPSKAGAPSGLELGFDLSNAKSSTKKIETILPAGISINPGVGNLAAGGATMTCAPADVAIDNCPANSKIGTVELKTPLLPKERTGSVFLEDKVGDKANERYRIGIYVSLPGGRSLAVHGVVTVDGSSDLDDGVGSVDQGTGQIRATFDNLPDLQFSSLDVTFNTTDGSGSHALLLSPETCDNHTVRANMVAWNSVIAGVSPDGTPTAATPANLVVTDCNQPEGPLGLDAALSSYGVGEHADFTLELTRPDSARSMKSIKFELPKGLVGSADATRDAAGDEITCADDAANAEIGNCPAETKVGEVEIGVGSTDDSFTMSGDIYNVTAPSNRPAKLVFSAHVEVGPFDLGRVVVPIDVNIDANEYFLWAETGDMPQRFEGIRVRVNSMKTKLFGMANAGAGAPQEQPFMSNPRSCDQAGLEISAKVKFVDGGTYTPTPAMVGPFHGCETLNLDDNTVTVENVDKTPEAPTALKVGIHQGDSPAQAGMKDLTLALPGFRVHAPVANHLTDADVCSADDLEAQNCPAKSRIGTAWLDTPLLPKSEYQDPDNPVGPQHSLWGAVYLTTPGSTAENRYRMAIQMTGKTLITIRGVAKIDETAGSPTEGDVVTEFKGLPDIPFTDMEVTVDGVHSDPGNAGDKVTPLLLNPENPDTDNPRVLDGNNGQPAVGADMTAWSDSAVVWKGSTVPVSVDPGTVKPFNPTMIDSFSTTQAGGHPDVSFVYTRPDGDLDIGQVSMHLPAGFLGSAAAVPQCQLQPNNALPAGGCPASSQVGSVEVTLRHGGDELELPETGKVFLTTGIAGDIAGMAISVRAKAGPYDLGDFVTQGRIQLRPSDHGIDVTFSNVPRMFKGVPTHIGEMKVYMPGVAHTGQPFMFNASTCGTVGYNSIVTPYGGAAVALPGSYTTTGCAGRYFAPAMSFHASNVVDNRTAPSWTINLATNPAGATMRWTQVTLPMIMTVNVAGLADACPVWLADQRQCHQQPASLVGSATIHTPLLPTPVVGNVYMATNKTDAGLPDMLIDIPKPIDMQIRGATSFFFVQNVGSQLRSTFENLPDLIWSSMTMTLNGGPKGILGLRETGACGNASVGYGSHSGQVVGGQATVTGLEAYCADANIDPVCLAPQVSISTRGIKKARSKNVKTKLTMRTMAKCKPIKSVRVTYPKGTKINKKLITWKKTKNKKLARRYKQNLKNLTGKIATRKVTSKDFKVVGKSGLTFKTTFPDGTRSFQISTARSAVVPSYKTFCGHITKKAYKKRYGKKWSKKYKSALKKCRNKKVTFRIDVVNTDGSTYTYPYRLPAGYKAFR